MAASNNSINSIFSNNSNSPSNVEKPSRLTELTSNLRKSLLSRNLYNEFTEYPLQPDTRQKIVNSINSILGTVAPFKSINLKNTVIGRLVTTPNTPLVDIGLLMLGKQFAHNFASNVRQETFPSINLRNVLDNNPKTKLFQQNIKFNITRKNESGNFEEFIYDFFGYHPRRKNPFNENTTNKEYLKNTGQAQLDFLYGNGRPNGSGLNSNLYKPSDLIYSEVGDLSKRSNIVGNGSSVEIKYFNFDDSKFNPYNQFLLSTSSKNTSAIEDANKKMGESYYTLGTRDYGQEYAPKDEFIDDLGKTSNNIKLFLESKSSELDNEWVDEEDSTYDVNNNIVWGRDGLSEYANDRLSNLRGLENDNITSNDDLNSKFKVNGGLLEYTRNLLNATRGQVVDQTRKVFSNNDRLDGFNGSGLWKASPTSINNFAGKIGIRQHSVLDQYDRFAKAIRFDGNVVYGGNPNSVIYNSVIPRVHPVLDSNGKIDNKNLSFSIENLAVFAIGGDENVGIIDDEYGTQIPRCEVGPFNGRIMWFPPYDLNIQEVSSAKYDTNVTIGRSEPMYSYMYSERSATLSFMLIIDYPEQVKNFLKTSKHKDLASFFAFGGQEFNPTSNVNNPSNKETNNKKKVIETEGPVEKTFPTITTPESISIYFPNDIPKVGETTASVIDKMYNDYHYEISDDIISKNDGKTFALNKDNVYLITGVTASTIVIPPGFKQSTARFIEGRRKLDMALYNLYNDPENVKFHKIRITATATLLYKPGINNSKKQEEANQYNLELSKRRAQVTVDFIKERIKKITGKSADTLGIVIETVGRGSIGNNDTKKSIPTRSAKKERSAIIEFIPTGVPPENKEVELTPDQEQVKETLKRENQALQGVEHHQNRNVNSGCIMNERKLSQDINSDNGILKGFQSITKNYFYPAFHSQTPEDFHKRLTFLQQCTRQGNAIKSTPEVDENGIARVKNSVFGKQPISILRVGDFFYTKVIIENVTVDYDDTTWDMNPEGRGFQPTIARVTLQMKVLGGQSLKGPIDALQNAVSFNYYANSTFNDKGGPYKAATNAADSQEEYINGILTEKQKQFKDNYKRKFGEDAYNEIFNSST